MRWRVNSLYWAADTKSFRNSTIYYSVVACPLCVPDLMTEQILADTTWTYFLSLVLSCQKIASIKCRWLYNTFDNYPVLRSPRKMSTTWCFCKCEWGSYGYVVDSIDDNIKWRVMLRSWFLCQTKVLASLSQSMKCIVVFSRKDSSQHGGLFFWSHSLRTSERSTAHIVHNNNTRHIGALFLSPRLLTWWHSDVNRNKDDYTIIMQASAHLDFFLVSRLSSKATKQPCLMMGTIAIAVYYTFL